MAKRVKKSIGQVLSPPGHSTRFTFGSIILFVLDVLVLFSTRIPLNFFRWLITMVTRGYIFYVYGLYYQEKLTAWAKPMDGFSLRAIFHNLFSLGFYLFCLWYFFTTLIILLAMFYHRQSGSVSSSISGSGSFDELGKFGDYLNNKARFSSYQSFLEFLQGKK